jgi:hypothetical protein
LDFKPSLKLRWPDYALAFVLAIWVVAAALAIRHSLMR